ncbi:MAG: hypothetical protein EXR75_06370 [Myxococcales bacterium]|nr:hypothetical protein [Myxococcales bacterium]
MSDGASRAKGATPAGAPCPHGNHYANTGPHHELRRVCNICGAPRVELRAEGLALSGDEAAPLRRAHAATKSRALSRFAGICGSLGTFGGAMTLLLTLVIDVVPVQASVVVGVLTLPFVLLAALGLARARSHTNVLGAALAEAWTSAVADLVRGARRALSTKDVASAFAISEPEADALLAAASAHHPIRSDVTDDGQLMYSSTAPLRIDAGDTPAFGPPATTAADAHDEEAELEARFAELAARENEARRGS